MKAITLLYHDVLAGADLDQSGFPGSSASGYKLEQAEFERHLEAIAAAIGRPPVTVSGLLSGAGSDRTPLLLSFDDGGISAHTVIAGLLEQHGWRGHFFITTDFIGQPGFVSREAIVDLRQRGHWIGSHSCTHPPRMSHTGISQIREEWRRSTETLAKILGEPVTTASVPGGFYSRQVAEAAAECGIQVMFNSEPQTRAGRVGSCLVLGRYTLFRGMTATTAAQIASGQCWPRCKQWASWNIKKAAKCLAGDYYLKFRRWVLEQREARRADPHGR